MSKNINKSIIVIICILCVFLMASCSFAADLDISNVTSNVANKDIALNDVSQYSANIAVSDVSEDSGNSFSLGSGVGDTDGIVPDQSSYSSKEGESAYITGKIYGTGDYMSGDLYEWGKVQLDYSFSGSASGSGSVFSSDSDSTFKIPLSSLGVGSYTFTISCEDSDYLFYCDVDSVDSTSVNVVVSSSQVTGVNLDSTSISYTNGDSTYLTGYVLDSKGDKYSVGSNDLQWTLGSNTGKFSTDADGNFRLLLGEGSPLGDLSVGNYSIVISVSNPSDVRFAGNAKNGTSNVCVLAPNPRIYVSTTGNDDTGNGSIDNPYATIAKAVAVANVTATADDIYVEEGTYVINKELSIKSDLNMIGMGNVVLTSDNTNHRLFYISPTYDVVFKNLMLCNASYSTGGAGSAIGTGSTTGTPKSLTITNCSFINCYNGWKGGAVASSMDTVITDCLFVNCSSRTQGGAISLDKSSTVNYNIFILCNSSKYPCVYGSSLDANYNFWGSNVKPVNVSVNNWVIIDGSINVSKVNVGDNVPLNFKLILTDGFNNSTLSKNLPNFNLTLSAILGTVNPDTITISDNAAYSVYTATTKGDETISVNPGDDLRFKVYPSLSNIVYVATDGDDTTGDGSEDNPYATISKALTQVTDTRNTIFIKKGNYTENNIAVTNDVTIIGETKDETIINGNQGQIFNIASNNVKFNNLVFMNGSATFGSAMTISTTSTVIIANSTFKQNSASKKGAIDVVGTVYVYDSSFVSNTASRDAAAICTETGKIYIYNSSFTNNTASRNAGAVGVSKAGYLLIDGCNFTSNSANTPNDSYGGAVYLWQGSNAEIKNSVFRSNYATLYGGALLLGKCTANVVNNTFIENNAGAKGGAIYVLGYDLYNVKLSQNTITDCHAGVSGDAISAESGSGSLGTVYVTYLENKTIDVDNLPFTLVATVTDDMGNPIDGALLEFTLNNTSYANVTVINGSASLTIDNLAFGNYLIGGDYSLSKPGYKSVVKTGAISYIKQSWFIDNYNNTGVTKGFGTLQSAVDAAFEGDIIYGLPGVYELEKEVNIGDRMAVIYKNVTIKANNTGEIVLINKNGRVFGVADNHVSHPEHLPSVLNLINITIKDSHEDKIGGYAGAIYGGFGSTITLTNCTIRDCSAGDKAGAIQTWGALYIYGCEFINNTAKGSFAGAIQTSGSRNTSVLYIENSKFINNTANTYAGAIYTDMIGKNVAKLVNTSFISNVGMHAGAIFSNINPLIVDSCIFANNSALGESTEVFDDDVREGGAIFARCDLNVSNTVFESNSAYSGGALYLAQVKTTIYTENSTAVEQQYYFINNCTFKNNAATIGGAISTGESLPKGVISNSQFINNKANGDGGAINIEWGEMNITNCNFESNSAKNGGVFLVSGFFSEAYLEDINGILNINNSNFSKNAANSDGGVLYLKNMYAKSNLNNNLFISNEAKFGGVIYNNGSLILSKNTLTNNTDVLGDIYNEGNLGVTNVTYMDNATVIVKDDTITITVAVTDDMGNRITGKTVDITANGVLIGSPELVEGMAILKYSFNNSGEYLISGYYHGSPDDVYTSNIKTGVINFTLIHNTTIVVKNLTLGLGSSGDLIATLTDVNGNGLDNKHLIAIINGTEYNVTTNSTGSAVFTVSFDNAGIYDVIVSFVGDDVYRESNASANIVVNKLATNLYAEDILVNVTLTGDVVVVLKDVRSNNLDGKIVNAVIDGSSYSAITGNGVAIFKVSLANVGTYEALFSFDGDDDYYASNASSNIIVTKLATSISSTNVNIEYGGSKNLVVTLKDAKGKVLAGKVVSITFDGKTYKVTTNAKGQAVLKVSGKAVKTYPVVIKFVGDKNYLSASATAKVTVVKATTKITRITGSTVKNHGNFYVKLTTKAGKVLANKVITMKSANTGKTYKLKTNAKGIAKTDLWVKVKPLGKYYSYTFKYAGSAYYKPYTVTFKVKIVK